MKRIAKLAIVLSLLFPYEVGYAKRIPNLEFKDLQGKNQKVESLRGSIVVLSFWATWCVPCREELPRLEKLSQQYGKDKVRFIGVSIDEPKDRAKIDPFLKQHDLHLEVWTGGTIDTLSRVGLENIVPGTLILDPDGQIIVRIIGEAQEIDISSRLDWLLQGRTGQSPEPLVRHY